MATNYFIWSTNIKWTSCKYHVSLEQTNTWYSVNNRQLGFKGIYCELFIGAYTILIPDSEAHITNGYYPF